MQSLVVLLYIPLWYQLCSVEWSTKQRAAKVAKVPLAANRQLRCSNCSSLDVTNLPQKCAISARQEIREINNITICQKNCNSCGDTDTSLLMSVLDRNQGSHVTLFDKFAFLRHETMPVVTAPTSLDFSLEYQSMIIGTSGAFDMVRPRASLISTTSSRTQLPSKRGISSFVNGTRQGCPFLQICKHLAGTRATSIIMVLGLAQAASVAVLVVILSWIATSLVVTVRSYLYLKCPPPQGPEIEGHGGHGDREQITSPITSGGYKYNSEYDESQKRIDERSSSSMSGNKENPAVTNDCVTHKSAPKIRSISISSPFSFDPGVISLVNGQEEPALMDGSDRPRGEKDAESTVESVAHGVYGVEAENEDTAVCGAVRSIEDMPKKNGDLVLLDQSTSDPQHVVLVGEGNPMSNHEAESDDDATLPLANNSTTLESIPVTTTLDHDTRKPQLSTGPTSIASTSQEHEAILMNDPSPPGDTFMGFAANLWTHDTSATLALSGEEFASSLDHSEGTPLLSAGGSCITSPSQEHETIILDDRSAGGDNVMSSAANVLTHDASPIGALSGKELLRLPIANVGQEEEGSFIAHFLDEPIPKPPGSVSSADMDVQNTAAGESIENDDLVPTELEEDAGPWTLVGSDGDGKKSRLVRIQDVHGNADDSLVVVDSSCHVNQTGIVTPPQDHGSSDTLHSLPTFDNFATDEEVEGSLPTQYESSPVDLPDGLSEVEETTPLLTECLSAESLNLGLSGREEPAAESGFPMSENGAVGRSISCRPFPSSCEDPKRWDNDAHQNDPVAVGPSSSEESPILFTPKVEVEETLPTPAHSQMESKSDDDIGSYLLQMGPQSQADEKQHTVPVSIQENLECIKFDQDGKISEVRVINQFSSLAQSGSLSIVESETIVMECESTLSDTVFSAAGRERALPACSNVNERSRNEEEEPSSGQSELNKADGVGIGESLPSVENNPISSTESVLETGTKESAAMDLRTDLSDDVISEELASSLISVDPQSSELPALQLWSSQENSDTTGADRECEQIDVAPAPSSCVPVFAGEGPGLMSGSQGLDEISLPVHEGTREQDITAAHCSTDTDDSSPSHLSHASTGYVCVVTSCDDKVSELGGSNCDNDHRIADFTSVEGQSSESPKSESLDKSSYESLEDISSKVNPTSVALPPTRPSSVMSTRGEGDGMNSQSKQVDDLDEGIPEENSSQTVALHNEDLYVPNDNSPSAFPTASILLDVAEGDLACGRVSAQDDEPLSGDSAPPTSTGIVLLSEGIDSCLIVDHSDAERDLTLSENATDLASPSNSPQLPEVEATNTADRQLEIPHQSAESLPGSLLLASATDGVESEHMSLSIEENDGVDIEGPSVYEMEPKRVIILVSNGVPDRVQAKNQWRAMNLLDAKGVPYTAVDAMVSTQRVRRNELLEISQVTNLYPQLFIEFSDGSTAFIGGWEFMEELNDASSLPKEVLDNNPQILTWEKMFSNVVESFGD